MRVIAAFLIFAATMPPALAEEAVTYAGTLGKLPIVVELAEPDADGDFVGRYAYLAKGGDIPLSGTIGEGGKLTIAEEAPCTPTICQNKDGETLEVAPIGANWTLEPGEGDNQLLGEWKDATSGKKFKVMLTRKGSRSLSADASGLDGLDPSLVLPRTGMDFLTPEDLPYDFIKTAYGLKEGKLEKMGDVEYRMDSDPRTGLSYPTFLKIGGQDVTKVNDWMLQQRVQSSMNGFYCLSKAYLGFYWTGMESDGTNGSFDGINTYVEYATDRLIGVYESGSFYCGGAYPNHFIDRHYVDVKTGKPVVPAALLKGWVAKNYDGQVVTPTEENKGELVWGPDDALVDFVNKRKGTISDIDEKECGLPDLIKSNLGAYFSGSDLIFTLDALPHVIFACTTDVMKVPLKDARPLFTDAGAKYFKEFD